MTDALNVLVVGGSQHIGYFSSLRFLDAGATVTFLMRSPEKFDQDEIIQKHVKSGKACLIKGDALVLEDVQKVWAKASEDKPVDVLLFTVGFTGSPKFSLLKGVQMSVPNLVTECLFNMLCEMPKTSPLPKVITLSSSGVSVTSRSQIPFLLKPMYGYVISQPLKDKCAMERVIFHCAGWNWNPRDGEPGEDMMGKDWRKREGLPKLTDAMVVRPALLNDGECIADTGKKNPYRTGEGEVKGYFVSRKDVAHFIFEAVTNHWEEYGNKQVSIAY